MTTFADNRLARMLEQGRLEVTVKSLKSGEHLTLKFAAKVNKPSGNSNWTSVPFDEATHVFVNDAHSWSHKVGTYYPDGTFRPASSDPARVWAAAQVLRYAFTGTHSDQCEIAESDNCGRCGRKLTDPVSIERGIGPECYGKMTSSKYHAIPAPAVSVDPQLSLVP